MLTLLAEENVGKGLLNILEVKYDSIWLFEHLMNQITFWADSELLEGLLLHFILIIIISVIDCIVIKPLINVIGINLIQKLVLLTDLKVCLGITRNP
jgi:hypothetical protein